MKRLLITGAKSYLGTSIEKYLNTFPNDFQVDTADLKKTDWRDRSFVGYDSVFHVAGIAHSDTGKISDEQKRLYKKINTDLAIETAKKAKSDGCRQFIFMSSIIVYGDSAPIGKKKIVGNETKPAPSNIYGRSKLDAENGISKLADENFKVVILRPPMIYGKGCKGNYVTLKKLAEKLPFFPNIKNERSMLYIGNFVEFVRLMIVNGESGVFFPQNSEYTVTSEMVRRIAELNGRKVRLAPGFGGLLKLGGHFVGKINKAFGNLTYDQKMSEYKENYRRYSLDESLKDMETGK